MTPASFVLAAALATWGPVWPAPETAEKPTGQPLAAPAPETPAPPEAPTLVKPLAPAAAPPAIIARGPVDVHARPALVATARQAHQPHKPLHKQWAFWVIAGGFFVGAVTAVVVATRPAPEAYRGNTPPYYVSFP